MARIDSALSGVGDAVAVTSCCAASVGLVVYPDGAVRSCCISNLVLGNLRDSTLLDIWQGSRRHDLRVHLDRGDFSMGCEGCEAELALEGRTGSYPESFDRFASSEHPVWPRWLYLNLTNACNLQCVQCDGELSSSIRRHREGLPALPRFAGEAFFADVRQFLPHLEELVIAGGEPFLAPETFRLLDLAVAVAPGLRCRIITNGTQWNDRVAEAIGREGVDVVVSIDGASNRTSESIRVGADFEQVLENLRRFIAAANSQGNAVEINHCLMAGNAREFADLLLLAESLGVRVNVSVVRDPVEYSIVHREPEEIASIHSSLNKRSDEMERSLELNLHTWRVEIARLATWATQPKEALKGHDQHKVMWFARDGDGPSDDRSALTALKAESVDGRVTCVRVGPGQRIIEGAGDDDAILNGTDLVGRHIRSILEPLAQRFGELRSMEAIDMVLESPDRVEQVVQFPDATLRVVTVPLRDATGRADAASVLLARIS